MRRAVALVLLLIPALVHSASYYVSPTGNDTSGNGSIEAPWFTLSKAWTVITAGDVIYMRGGTYAYTSTQVLTGKNGTSESRITITSYGSEVPKVTKGGSFTYHNRNFTSLIFISANYITISKLELTGFTQQDIYLWMPICLHTANNCILQELKVHHNGNGIRVTEASGSNLIVNCDIHDNHDPVSSTPYDDSDGINIDYIPAGNTNTIRGCRIYYNADDGVDLWRNNGIIVVDNCWIWGNGYAEDHVTEVGNGNAIKLGETTTTDAAVRRIITNNLMFLHIANAVDQNAARAVCHVYNNTIWGNDVGINLWDYNLAHIIQNNAVFGNNDNYSNGDYSNTTRDYNSYDATWQPSGIVTETSDFASIDTTGVSSTRQGDGSLPTINFLRLSANSRLRDAGTDVGIPFSGSAPDLGAFEYIPEPTPSDPLTKPIIKCGKVWMKNKKIYMTR